MKFVQIFKILTIISAFQFANSIINYKIIKTSSRNLYPTIKHLSFRNIIINKLVNWLSINLSVLTKWNSLQIRNRKNIRIKVLHERNKKKKKISDR